MIEKDPPEISKSHRSKEWSFQKTSKPKWQTTATHVRFPRLMEVVLVSGKWLWGGFRPSLKERVVFQPPIFRGYVSFRESKQQHFLGQNATNNWKSSRWYLNRHRNLPPIFDAKEPTSAARIGVFFLGLLETIIRFNREVLTFGMSNPTQQC